MDKISPEAVSVFTLLDSRAIILGFHAVLLERRTMWRIPREGGHVRGGKESEMAQSIAFLRLQTNKGGLEPASSA